MKMTNPYIRQSDFDGIGNVAQHCDLSKLQVAINQALEFDIIPLFCYEFMDDVLKNWNNTESKYQFLIYGGTFTDRAGRLRSNIGLKRVWLYYSYAQYLLINQFSDTANGQVRKDSEWSIPVPLGEITAYSNKYRKMGREACSSVLDYLTANKIDFPLANHLACGCSGTCNCGKTKKMTGFKFSTVKK
mgnify:CR=1 FL=1